MTASDEKLSFTNMVKFCYHVCGKIFDFMLAILKENTLGKCLPNYLKKIRLDPF